MDESVDGFTAVVPVREGSRRLPGKNLQDFCGKSLLEHKIDQLAEFLPKAQILVSSDSSQMLALAERKGVRTHERDEEYADDVEGKPLGETISHIVSQTNLEHILWAQVTSPLINSQVYCRAISQYLSKLQEGFDSLISVQRVHDYLWTQSGPLNFRTGEGHVPSQQLPLMWRLTYGVILAPREKIINWAYYYGQRPFLFEVNKFEAVDIDDKEDLEIAKAIHLATRKDDLRDNKH